MLASSLNVHQRRSRFYRTVINTDGITTQNADSIRMRESLMITMMWVVFVKARTNAVNREFWISMPENKYNYNTTLLIIIHENDDDDDYRCIFWNTMDKYILMHDGHHHHVMVVYSGTVPAYCDSSTWIAWQCWRSSQSGAGPNEADDSGERLPRRSLSRTTQPVHTDGDGCGDGANITSYLISIAEVAEVTELSLERGNVRN